MRCTTSCREVLSCFCQTVPLNNVIQVKNDFILKFEQIFYEMYLFQKHIKITVMLKIQFRAFEA